MSFRVCFRVKQGGYGGVFAFFATLTFINSVFNVGFPRVLHSHCTCSAQSNSVVDAGAGLYLLSCTTTMTGCSARANSARRGAVVYVQGSLRTQISPELSLRVVTKTGGSIAVVGGRFTSNAASAQGGAFYFISARSPVSTIASSTLLFANTAPQVRAFILSKNSR